MKKKGKGGLCSWLAKRHKWPKTKEQKCINKAIRGRSKRRRS
jgi:hypothetical protein